MISNKIILIILIYKKIIITNAGCDKGPGYYGHYHYSSNCYGCTNGRYQPLQQCISNEKTQPGNDPWCCKPCPAGYKRLHGPDRVAKCVKCDPKRYRGEKDSSCRQCPHAFRQHEPTAPDSGQTKCACKPGLYGTVDMKRGGGHTCKSCPSGAYCIDGNINYCSPGTYQNQNGQSSCKSCSKGKYQSSYSKTSCSSCSSGKFSTVYGNGESGKRIAKKLSRIPLMIEKQILY